METTVKFKRWNCKVEFAHYSNGRTAIELVTKNGSPVAVATVNIPEYKLPRHYALIKNWSENEGVLQALEGAGIIEDTGKTVATGFVEANLVKIL